MILFFCGGGEGMVADAGVSIAPVIVLLAGHFC